MSYEIENVQELNSASIPEAGMMQTRTAYSTAVQVIRPRNLMIVEKRCLEEAAIAGEEFYYSWSQGGKIIEGLTVGASLAIARNFGNCAIETRIDETKDAFIFYGAFIDLETGFNIIRPFRQNKELPKKKDGTKTYSDERGKDVQFQIGASKAMRNAALNAVPKWLASKVLIKAKENVVGKIEQMGVEKARGLVLGKIEALKIPIDRIEAIYGKAKGWDVEKLVLLSGAIRSIEDGFESMDSLFPEQGETQHKNQETEGQAQVQQNQAPKVIKLKVESAEVVKPHVNINWESPVSITAHINRFLSVEDLQEFITLNKANLSCFSGKDDEMIQNAIEQRIKLLLKKK